MAAALCIGQAHGQVATDYMSGAVFGPTFLSNCEFNQWGVGQTSTTELTNILNATQLNTLPTPGYTFADLPSTKELFPWSANGDTVYKAPAYSSKCWNRSIGYFPSDCEGDCLQYLDLFNATWLALGELICAGSYPVANLTSTDSPIPPPGNVSVVLTNQCGQYRYEPPAGQNSTWMYVATDTWGNKWALQTSMINSTTDEEWATQLEAVVLPPGWTMENVTITETEIHLPYLQGEDCFVPGKCTCLSHCFLFMPPP